MRQNEKNACEPICTRPRQGFEIKFRRCSNTDVFSVLILKVSYPAGRNTHVFTQPWMNRLIRKPNYTWEGHACSSLSHFLKMSVGIRSCCSSLPYPFSCSMDSAASINIFSAPIAGPPYKITQYILSAPDTGNTATASQLSTMMRIILTTVLSSQV